MINEEGRLTALAEKSEADSSRPVVMEEGYATFQLGKPEGRRTGEPSQDSPPNEFFERGERPLAPSSTASRVIASNIPSPGSVPVPTLPDQPAGIPVESGDRFGDGWGAGGDGAGGGFGTVTRNSIDGVLNREGVRGRGNSEPYFEQIRGGVRVRISGDGPRGPQFDRERYGQLVDQPWKTPWQDPLSTFSVDVDTASYTNIRRMLTSGVTVPKDAVRTEECINYFDYRYEGPKNGGPFAVHVEMAKCPWNDAHHLAKIGLKGREVDTNNRPPSNLVFLIDVSGSMKSADKLPLLVESMKILVEELDERDTVGIVVYASAAGTVLEPTQVVGQGRAEILSALDNLRAGGSTAMERRASRGPTSWRSATSRRTA